MIDVIKDKIRLGRRWLFNVQFQRFGHAQDELCVRCKILRWRWRMTSESGVGKFDGDSLDDSEEGT